MPELLSPAGDMKCLRTAFHFGADAAYIGGPAFQLRAAKAGFSRDEVTEAAAYAHDRGRKLYVAVNAFAQEEDLKYIGEYARFLSDAGVDAVIVSDLGVLSIIRRSAPGLEIHISTQANTINSEAVRVFSGLGASRIILGRECTLDDIRSIRQNTPPHIKIECFIHGAMCMAYSGRCILSSYLAARSANKGGCTQPCRWNYVLEEETRPGMYLPIEESERGTAILSSHDLCCIDFLDELKDAGVDSLKIEGRMKSEYYIAAVVNAYRKRLDGGISLEDARRELDSITHRPYSTGFYFSELKYGHDNRGEYISDCIFAGVALSNSGSNTMIEQRGNFRKGDTLEVLTPDRPVYSITIEEMYDETGEAVVSANRSGHVYTIGNTVEPMSILRLRTKAEG